MLLRIDCPNCNAEYAWQTSSKKQAPHTLEFYVNLYCTKCDHVGGGTAIGAITAAVTAVDCYRIQTTAKEESA